MSKQKIQHEKNDGPQDITILQAIILNPGTVIAGGMIFFYLYHDYYGQPSSPSQESQEQTELTQPEP